MTPFIVAFVCGASITAYSLWALYSGQVVSTWFQTAYRPSPIYWITVGLLFVFGMANVVAGVAAFFR